MSQYEIKHSTELMENYLQATIMAPEKNFQALHRSDSGGALLFSIGDDGSFNVTSESPGRGFGWKQAVSLSKRQADQDCPGSPCQHFAVAQRADGSIQMAMVLRETKNDKSNDHLYLGYLSVSESADIDLPTWTPFPYDDTKTSRPSLEIAGIFFSEATDGEYIVADVVRDPSSPIKEIVRYYIDSGKYEGHAWHLHDVPVDIESKKYTSVLGRKDGATVDGIYTSGQIDGSPQIIYTPLYNKSRRDRHSDYLKLTPKGDLVADAIAACRNPDNTSDLYATAKGVLYRFASTNQGGGAIGATAVVATENALFQGVKDLFAFAYADSIMVWGRNADNAVFYTTCPRSKLDTPNSWSFPLPILTGVEHLSPFVNRANSANTIFAHTGGSEMKMGVKSPGTGTWTWRNVTLPPADKTVPARKFNSYTTRIQVTDEHRQPANNVTLAVSATNVTSVYINHLYYVVGPAAIRVETDQAGSVTIVEAVPRLTGTQFDVSVVGDAASKKSINPMEKTFKKATALTSVDSLKGATITSYVKGPNGPQKATPRKLLRNGIDDPTLEKVAHLNRQLTTAYANQEKGPATKTLLELADYNSEQGFIVPETAPKVDAGDLFQFLETKSAEVKLRAAVNQSGGPVSTQESFWEMLVRWFEDAWEFVVKIGEAIYRCVLEVIEDFVSAVRWVFDKIVTAIEDLIEFLQYLFEWDDFKRTKDVIKNMTWLFLNHQVDQIPVVKKEFDDAVKSVIEIINDWAGIPDFSKLGSAGSGRMSSQNKADGPDAPGSLLIHHFQGNINSASHDTTPSVPQPPPSSLLEALENAMLSKEATLGEAFDQLQELMREAHSMSVIDILKGLTGILAGEVLRSAQVVIDALLDLIYVVAKEALELFDLPVHIPVISDILNEIGIPDFSMLDVVCWIAAVPVTIGYKLAEELSGKGHKAPFPDNDKTKFLIEAKDFQLLVAAFNGATHPLQSADTVRAATTADKPIIPMSKEDAEILSISFHFVSGYCGGLSAFSDSFESMIPESEVSAWLSVACVASAIVGGGSRAAANVLVEKILVPRYPIEGFLEQYYTYLTTGFFLLNKVVWGLLGIIGHTTARKWGAGIDAVLVLPACAITCIHFHQLTNKDEGKARTIAILDETSFMATYVARVLYTVVVTGLLDADEEVKAGVATAMGVAQVVHGVLQLSEAAVEGLG